MNNKDYLNPSTMTNDDLAEFARTEHIYHRVGHTFDNGEAVVDDIYKEIANRLVKSVVKNEN